MGNGPFLGKATTRTRTRGRYAARGQGCMGGEASLDEKGLAMWRSIFGFIGGGATLLETGLGAYLAIAQPPSDDARLRIVHLLVALGIIAILSLAAFAVCEILREKELRRRDTEIDGKFDSMSKLLERLVPKKQLETKPESTKTLPTTFRQQVFELVAKIRALVRSHGHRPTAEQEYDISTRFLAQEREFGQHPPIAYIRVAFVPS